VSYIRLPQSLISSERNLKVISGELSGNLASLLTWCFCYFGQLFYSLVLRI
jgi:hypothetical protein